MKIDDMFFKDKFDCSDFEDSIYNQLAKTMARNVDIDLAKTPLVDILTGYTRYKEAEQQLDQLTNNWNELEEWLKSYIALIENPDTLEEQTLEDLKEVLDKMKEIKGGNNEVNK